MMFRSLFGDLYPARLPSLAGRREPDNDFEATAILAPDEALTRLGGNGDWLDHAARSHKDVLVAGSVSQTLRGHLTPTPSHATPGERTITLHDPSQMWAHSVIRALADASGQPVERLQLRDQDTLVPLAVIERTALPQRDDDTLRLHYADVQVPAGDATSLPYALMEHADLAVIIVGPLHGQALDGLMIQLRQACASETWRCPQLLFLLPVGAEHMAGAIRQASWPAGMQVHTSTEPLTSASIVWNLLLSHWNRVKPVSVDQARAILSPAELDALTAPALPAWSGTETAAFAGKPAMGRASHEMALVPAADAAGSPQRPAPSAAHALAVLQELVLLDGLIFAALVDVNDGGVVASEGRGPDIDRAAVAAAEILRTHRKTLRQMGHWRANEPVDEVLVTAGSRYHILRSLQAHPDLFILAVLDKLRSNLAITRFRIMEAQQVLN